MYTFPRDPPEASKVVEGQKRKYVTQVTAPFLGRFS